MKVGAPTLQTRSIEQIYIAPHGVVGTRVFVPSQDSIIELFLWGHPLVLPRGVHVTENGCDFSTDGVILIFRHIATDQRLPLVVFEHGDWAKQEAYLNAALTVWAASLCS